MKVLVLFALCAGALAIYGADARQLPTLRPWFADVEPTFHPRLEVTGRPPVEARIDVACLEPKYPGPCKGYFPRYYFNITTKTCEQFIYGGCQANGNNFVTIEECRNRCRYIPTRPSGEDLFTEVPLSAFRADEPELLPYKEEKISARIDIACLDPKKPGPCAGYFPRYYFNITTKTCEQFIYGGCQANGNNFETIEECTNRCRYIRTRTSRGEGSTETPFSAFLDDESELSPYQERISARIDVACLDPKKPGPCAGYFPRYYFNITTKTCEEFIYGGCQGNGNNFETIEECRSRCRYIPSEITSSDVFATELPYMGSSVYHEPTDVPPYIQVSARIDIACREPKYPGPCRGYFPRYYYNNITKTCEQFIYGGCQGNGNNFETEEECKNRCWASLEQAHTPITNAFDLPVWPFKPPQVCTYPADSGPCKAYVPRFFYNTLTKACEEFIYGGCGGNKNNFLTFDQCDKKCKKIIGVIPRA